MAAPVEPSQTGSVTLDLSSAPLGGHINNYIDTLHSDYAFIITPGPFVKSMEFIADSPHETNAWDFALFPNPAQDAVFLVFEDELPKQVVISDVAGRTILMKEGVTSLITEISLDHLTRGIYWMRIRNGSQFKAKKFIIT